MSKRNEDRDVFFIPPNFLTSGRLFGGSIRFRNAIEASILVLITAFPIITPRVTCGTCSSAAIFKVSPIKLP